MPPIRRIYMMTDLEGVAGVDDWDPRHREDAATARGIYDRSEMQRLLTAEVNAAAEELFDAGVEHILINDGHGAGRTILPEQLIGGVRIVRGRDRPGPLPGINDSFDALVQVGMHAMSDTPRGNLAHTMARAVRCYRLNGREIGEMQVAAYLAAELGAPWIFTAGDLHACRESEAWVPGIVTAAVKEGLSESCAIHLSPPDARALIRQRIGEAVTAAKGEVIDPLKLEPPVVLEIEMRQPMNQPPEPPATAVDDRTIRYEGASAWDVFGQPYGLSGPVPTQMA